MQTLQENEEGYSQRQIQDAKNDWDLYAKVGYPSARDFQQTISQNLILNCPVTVGDVARTDKIYGKDIHALKVKNYQVQTKTSGYRLYGNTEKHPREQQEYYPQHWHYVCQQNSFRRHNKPT